jgi:phage repressor protein C with HTH and peptisase S24 domain
MEPVFRDGDSIIVSPQANIRRGDRVVVKTKGGEVMVKVLLRQSARKLDLQSLNPNHEDRGLLIEEIDWMARVVWASK